MRLKKANSSRVWEQEWIAKFIAGTGAVFRNVNACVKNADSNPRSGHYYFMGLDLAKHQDWTVMTVIDARTFEVVHIDRFNQIDWPLQKLRIFETAPIPVASIQMVALLYRLAVSKIRSFWSGQSIWLNLSIWTTSKV